MIHHPGLSTNDPLCGFSVRDHLALVAMNALLSQAGRPGSVSVVAEEAYRVADAMIAESRKEAKSDEPTL